MNNSNVTLRLDFRIISILLALVIVGMLAVWRPWQGSSDTTRKIEITGETTIKAEPDEFVFTPYFEQTGSDREALTAALTKQANEVVAKLKELGVADKNIKLSGSAYDRYYYPVMPMEDGSGDVAVNAYLTITVGSKDLAQKVQDYLLTVSPKGQLTPQPQFSTAKQKQLETTARDKALVEARQKAERTASQLGAKLGKVLEVKDTASQVFPWLAVGATADSSSGNVKSTLPVQPGENDFNYSVTVTYQLR